MDPLQDVRHYSPTMTISQVILFCERKNMNITRGMIQNYIRDGLLPSPVNKRFYTHKHLAALVLIYRLKTVFDMPTIKEAMLPYMDEEGVPLEIYEAITEKMAGIVAAFTTAIAPGLATEDDGGALLTMVFATELKNTIVG